MLIGGEISQGYNTMVINAVVSANVNSIDFRTKILASGWDGVSPVTATLTINSGVYIGATSSSVYSLTITGSFPSGSTLNLINNGHISGAGGTGGGDMAVGGSGGDAVQATIPVNITNNGDMWGGGGGGGGGQGRHSQSTAGGAGAGRVPGVAVSTFYAATSTVGGAGQPSSSGYTAGGGGGNIGLGGGAGGGNGYYGGSGAAGGLAGRYIVGNSNVTWLVTGTRLGRVA